MGAATRILLIGGGHSHVEVLRRFALVPDPAVALTLVSPDADTPYSGMLPGLVAGHYTREETHIALAPLAARAGARFVIGRVDGLDLATHEVVMDGGARAGFDLVSLDIGSTPDAGVPGARDHAIPVKPVDRFLDAWTGLQADAAAGAVRTIAVVGGGAGGVELLLAMQARLVATLAERAPHFAVCTDQPTLLVQHSRAVRVRFERLLAQRGVAVHLASRVTAVEPGALVVTGGRHLAADRVVWATAASAQAWVAASGLACDARGFVRVDEALRSPSHPCVFAVGDCATQDGHPRPKSGVYAVRQGPPLADNLRRAAHGQPLRRFVPQRNALALISTGDRHAIASRGGFVAEGDWVWRWKDRIDRRFMAKYELAPAEPPPSGPHNRR
jgi:selenide,water dikinase